jgi:lipopolysaccharide biosynthesis regulator YciM
MAMALLRLLEKKPDEAAEHFKAVLRAYPKHAEANLLLANHYESRGKPASRQPAPRGREPGLAGA